MSNEQGVGANKVIDKLSEQIAGLNRELAIANILAEERQEVIVKQQKLIDAYEDKDKSQESDGDDTVCLSGKLDAEEKKSAE